MVGDHAFPYGFVRQQSPFDFVGLHTVSRDFHLTVDPSEILEREGIDEADQVAGAVHAIAGVVWVGDESLRGRVLAAVIARSQSEAGDTQLAGHTFRHRRQAIRQHGKANMIGRPADRHAQAGISSCVVTMDHAANDCFGGAVLVVNLDVGSEAGG